MARLNQEDEWFTDPLERRVKLIIAIQNDPVDFSAIADGLAARAWRLAQKYWKDDRKLIPEDEWKRAKLERLIEVDLAVRREDGIYVRGAKAKFDWLVKAKEFGSEGGKKSAEGREKKKKERGSKGASRVRKGSQGSERVSNPLSLSLSLTPSPSRESSTLSTADLAVGRDWLDLAHGEMPWKADDPKWTAELFAEAIGKVKRATDLNDDGIRAVFEFVKVDDFWRKNAATPMGLLKRSSRNGERKVDNILVRMRQAPTKQQKTDAGGGMHRQPTRQLQDMERDTDMTAELAELEARAIKQANEELKNANV